MSLFHHHEWKTVDVEYTPPTTRAVKYGLASEEFAADIVFGFTVITQRCSSCGRVKAQKVNGRVKLLSEHLGTNAAHQDPARSNPKNAGRVV